jgi:hypothetical protein
LEGSIDEDYHMERVTLLWHIGELTQEGIQLLLIDKDISQMDHLIEDPRIRVTINIHHHIEINITIHPWNIVDIRGTHQTGIIRGGLLHITTGILGMHLLTACLHHNILEQVLTHRPHLIMITPGKMGVIVQEKIHIITEVIVVRRHVITIIVVDTLLILL